MVTLYGYIRTNMSFYQSLQNYRTDPRNLTDLSLNYSIAPVRIQRKQLLDKWEDSIRPLSTVYQAKVNVTYDSNYIFRVSERLIIVCNNYNYNNYLFPSIQFKKLYCRFVCVSFIKVWNIWHTGF